MPPRRFPPSTDVEKVFIAQMALDELPTPTIHFFRTIYPMMATTLGQICTQTEMAELSNMTPNGAKRHLGILTRRGWLNRDHYRGWSLPEKFPITDPLLQAIYRSL